MIRTVRKPGPVVQTWTPATWKAEEEGVLSLKAAWTAKQVHSQLD